MDLDFDFEENLKCHLSVDANLNFDLELNFDVDLNIDVDSHLNFHSDFDFPLFSIWILMWIGSSNASRRPTSPYRSTTTNAILVNACRILLQTRKNNQHGFLWKPSKK